MTLTLTVPPRADADRLTGLPVAVIGAGPSGSPRPRTSSSRVCPRSSTKPATRSARPSGVGAHQTVLPVAVRHRRRRPPAPRTHRLD